MSQKSVVPAEPIDAVPVFSDRTAVDLTVSPETSDLMADGVAPNTRRAYIADRAAFWTWCAQVGRTPLPCTAQTLAEYVAFLGEGGAITSQGRKGPAAPKTIQRALAAIRAEHRAAGYEPPDGKAAQLAQRGVRKRRAEERKNNPDAPAPRGGKADPLLLDDVRKLVDACDPLKPAGIRDRALIVASWTLMARRSEVVTLDWPDLTEGANGIDAYLPWSKTDQDAQGVTVGLPYGSHPETCPVRLLKAWAQTCAEHGLSGGPVFRAVDRHGRIAGEPSRAGGKPGVIRMSGDSVGAILQRAAFKAGVSMTKLSAHSVRSGGATSAYMAGATPLQIARHGRWKDGSPVLLGYIRTVDRWKENPMVGIGL